MEILRDVLLVLHFIGLASLLGGFLVQMKGRSKRIEPAMVHGALTQLVTGLALVGLAESSGAEMDTVKVGVKLIVLLVILVLVWRGRKARHVGTTIWGAIGALTVINIIVAVAWR